MYYLCVSKRRTKTLTPNKMNALRQNTEAEFKLDTFEAELLNDQENNYTVKVVCESYSYQGEVRVVKLEITGEVCQYTLSDVQEVLAQRNGKYMIFMETTPILKLA